MVPWAIALHGGAGAIDKNMDERKKKEYEDALSNILQVGVEAITSAEASNEGQPLSALDVAELVVRALEDCPLFNAGHGSVLTNAGTVEMEASIMAGPSHEHSTSEDLLHPNGADGPASRSQAALRCGAVSGLITVVHPISLARLVMEKTPHIYLAFDGAEDFATEQDVERQPNEWFITEARRTQWEEAHKAQRIQLDHYTEETVGSLPPTPTADMQASIFKTETVGCVVVDSLGQCAAATSTGGLTNKMVGRIGDTPVLGAGNYANELCAVSATGTGEEIIRATVGREVAAVMEYKGLALSEAAEYAMGRTPEGACGLVAVSRGGDVTMKFNTLGMFRACATEDGRREIGIW